MIEAGRRMMLAWPSVIMERTMQEKSTTNQPLYRRTWVAILAAAAVLFLLVLVVLPYGISYGLHQWLLANGGDDVQLEDLDFNVFTGRATVTNLNVIADGQPRLLIPKLELDLDWMPLFSKHVDARAITFDGVEITIIQAVDGSLRIGGISLPEAEDEVGETTEEPWGFGLEALEIINTTITYVSPGMQLVTRLDRLTLSHLVTWTTDPARLVLNGIVNDAPVTLDGQLPALSNGFGFTGKLDITSLPLHTFATFAEPAVTGLGGQFSISSELDVLLTPAASLAVSHTGVLRLEGLALEQNGRQVSYADLQWQGELKLATTVDSGALDLDLQGVITGKDLGVADDDYQLSYADQEWQGALTLQSATGNGGTNIQLQGDLTGNDLAVLVPAEALTVYHGSFLWDGAVAVESGENTAVTAEGHLKFGRLGADVADSKVSLASIDDLAVEKLGLLENGDITVTGLAVTGAVFAKDTAATGSKESSGGSVLSAGRITADSIQVTAGNQVAIGLLEWRDVISLIQRDPNGEWRPVRIIHTLPFANTDTEEKQPAAEENAEAAAGRVRVDEIRVVGDSAIILDDKTVKPPFNMRLTVTEAVLKNIDNGQPGQNSPISIKGRISKHSHISVEGTMQPFAEQPTLDLKNHVDGISLPPLSPYTVAALGYALESGHLNADSTLKINKGKIDSQNNLIIRGLEITGVDNESRKKLDGQLLVPLGTGLSMLRDSNDTITLDLPVSGDIDSPDFGIGDIINTAMSKAIKQGSMTYLKLALQPYGALITVAQLAGEEATKVRLQPVSFESGQVTTLGEADSYLKKVAGILKDRPELNIKICGLAVAADRVALAGGAVPKETGSKAAGSAVGVEPVTDQQLLDLAKQRAGFVKDHLVTKYGATASRLVACTPHIDDAEDDDNVPRVDLLI
jgi:hypothetical protein